MKNKFFKGQIAIEYLLLLTICALVTFWGFKTFFQEGGAVRDPMTNYFVKVQGELMGDAPDLSGGYGVGPCGWGDELSCVNTPEKSCWWVKEYQCKTCEENGYNGLICKIDSDVGCVRKDDPSYANYCYPDMDVCHDERGCDGSCVTEYCDV